MGSGGTVGGGTSGEEMGGEKKLKSERAKIMAYVKRIRALRTSLLCVGWWGWTGGVLNGCGYEARYV